MRVRECASACYSTYGEGTVVKVNVLKRTVRGRWSENRRALSAVPGKDSLRRREVTVLNCQPTLTLLSFLSSVSDRQADKRICEVPSDSEVL